MIPIAGALATKVLDVLWKRSRKRKVATILAGILATVLAGWGLSPDLAQQVADLVVALLAG